MGLLSCETKAINRRAVDETQVSIFSYQVFLTNNNIYVGKCKIVEADIKLPSDTGKFLKCRSFYFMITKQQKKKNLQGKL